MAKSCSGSTAPSLGMRSRTCPYEASTSKSLPRYFLIVFALAGDSTMTRLSAITRGRTGKSMRGPGVRVGDQILQTLEGELLSRLAGQHHQHYPFQLLRVELIRIEREHAIDDDFALARRQNPHALEREQEAAAFRRQSCQLAIGKDADRGSARV